MGYTWLKEAEAEFGIACFIILLRVFARTKLVGFRGWQGDDYLILVALATYIVQAYCYPVLYAGTLFKPDKSTKEQMLEVYIKGVKYNMLMWTLYVVYIWSLKGCMLFFYGRLTKLLPRHRMVKTTGWICGATFVACVIALWVHCLPLNKVWQFSPDPGIACSTSLVNFLVVGILNFLTDAILLCIPIPLLYRLKVSFKRKLIIYVLLCSGVFIMAATLIRNIVALMGVYNKQLKTSNMAIAFAIRENFVACIVVNAPCIKPLFFPKSWFKSTPRGPVLPFGSITAATEDVEKESEMDGKEIDKSRTNSTKDSALGTVGEV